MSTDVQSIMVRAKITRDEWERLRVLSILRGKPSSEIVGKLIRDFVDRHAPSPAETRKEKR